MTKKWNNTKEHIPISACFVDTKKRASIMKVLATIIIGALLSGAAGAGVTLIFKHRLLPCLVSCALIGWSYGYIIEKSKDDK